MEFLKGFFGILLSLSVFLIYVISDSYLLEYIVIFLPFFWIIYISKVIKSETMYCINLGVWFLSNLVNFIIMVMEFTKPVEIELHQPGDFLAAAIAPGLMKIFLIISIVGFAIIIIEFILSVYFRSKNQQKISENELKSL